jgi:hypothetical protein
MLADRDGSTGLAFVCAKFVTLDPYGHSVVLRADVARTTAASWRSQGCAAKRTPSGPISPG